MRVHHTIECSFKVFEHSTSIIRIGRTHTYYIFSYFLLILPFSSGAVLKMALIILDRHILFETWGKDSQSVT